MDVGVRSCRVVVLVVAGIVEIGEPRWRVVLRGGLALAATCSVVVVHWTLYLIVCCRQSKVGGDFAAKPTAIQACLGPSRPFVA